MVSYSCNAYQYVTYIFTVYYTLYALLNKLDLELVCFLQVCFTIT